MVGRVQKLYLCDGKKECWASPFCGVNNHARDDTTCYYTSDYEHAKNKGKEMKFEETSDMLLDQYFKENGYDRTLWEVE